ncbi:MAG: VWA domain-containing protein [Planctomycetes bacterium]|jgi:Mg-chelatase subunit ChlD|nr:VWA domain-containing protein [Planctomycetota bacterium]
MIAALGAALLLAAVGLLAVRTAPAAARWSMWCLLLAIGALALRDPAVGFDRRERAALAVATVADAAALRTRLLQAAAAVGPPAVELAVHWRESLSALDPAPGPFARLGAAAALPTPMPFAPAALQLLALAPAAVDRPLALQLAAVPVAVPWPAVLRLRVAGDVVAEERLQLGPSTAVLTAYVPSRAGVHEVELVAELDGRRLSALGELPVGPAPEVLLLEPSGLAAAALKAQGLAVVSAASPPDDWRRYAAVVIGQPLPVAAQQELLAAVIDGTGAFVLAPAFDAPGAPMRALLPLRPLPPVAGPEAGPGNGRAPARPNAEPSTPPPPPPPSTTPPRGDTEGAGRVAPEPIEVDKRSIAMVLVVDRSGSMGNLVGGTGYTKMSYAKTSALQTARALGPGDLVGLVTFGNKDAGRVELPLTDATATAAVRAGIEALKHATEQTFLLSGLRLAHDRLRACAAAVKHVVVISDGEFFTSERIALQDEALAMRGDRISLSVISIVDASTDPAFKTLAEELTRDGGGTFLPTSDPSLVPTFVTAEVTRALQRVGRKPRPGDGGPAQSAPPAPEAPPPPPPPPPAPEPAPEVPPPQAIVVRALTPSRLLLPTPSAWPTLGAAVAGEAPLDAQVLLIAGEEGWPLLAFGNRGLGRVGAFAADLCGPDGAEFRREAAFSARLAQWVQTLLPALPAEAPRSLLQQVTVTPPAPWPAERAALAAMAGTEPVPVDALPQPGPQLVRHEHSLVPAGAQWLLLGLVGVAAAERWLRLRALRRGESP